MMLSENRTRFLYSYGCLIRFYPNTLFPFKTLFLSHHWQIPPFSWLKSRSIHIHMTQKKKKNSGTLIFFVRENLFNRGLREQLFTEVNRDYSRVFWMVSMFMKLFWKTQKVSFKSGSSKAEMDGRDRVAP